MNGTRFLLHFFCCVNPDNGALSDALEQPSQARFQSFADLLNVQQRHVPHSTLDPAVVRPMQPASLRSLFLVNALLFPYAADGAAKADADVEGHCTPSSRHAADAYTADESHLC
jgi:hypothetical protein